MDYSSIINSPIICIIVLFWQDRSVRPYPSGLSYQAALRSAGVAAALGPGGDISLSDFLGWLLGEFTATLDEELRQGADGAILQDDDANRRVAK